ncbi:MAG: hypothetical protein JKY92_05900 [Magnetovibrio sp.]|nr:hypothetical protein [Magnetovibrio sp.]
MTLPSPDLATRRTTLALAAAVFIAVCLVFIPSYFGNLSEPFVFERFVGSDTYMRVLRVRDWWDAGQWYQTFSPRSNWPYGETLHWTRPFDVLLVILAAPFAPFVGMHKALFFSGVIISPILLVSTIWVMVWGSRPFLNPKGRVILVILFTFQPITHYYYVAARPDHHSMILFGFATVLVLLARFAHAPANSRSAVAWAGAMTAFGLWVSVESLSIELFALLAIGGLWIWHGHDEWLSALRRYATVGALAILVALFIERPPHEWLGSEEYDRLSTVHVALLALIALGIEGMWRLRHRYNTSLWGRAGAAVGAAICAALVMHLLFPDFFKGPFGAAMEPRLQDMWLNKIKEFQPLTKTDTNTIITALVLLVPTAWLMIWGGIIAKTRPRSQADINQFVVLAVAVGLYVPLTLLQSRWGGYMGIAVLPGWVLLLQHILKWHGGPLIGSNPGTPVYRAPLFCLVAVGHLLLTVGLKIIVNPPELAKPKPCLWREITPYLNSPDFADGRPQTFLTFIHQGPEFIYRTKHRVVGTPYHRNTAGLLDSFTAFTSTNEAESKAIFEKRKIDYLLTCVKAVEEKFFLEFKGDTLMRKITQGNPPKWLKPAPLPDGLAENFHLYHFQSPPKPQRP